MSAFDFDKEQRSLESWWWGSSKKTVTVMYNQGRERKIETMSLDDAIDIWGYVHQTWKM